MSLKFVIHACAISFHRPYYACGGYVCRVGGIYFYIGHGWYDSRQHYIPALLGIFVDANLDALKHFNLSRECFQCCFELASASQAFFCASVEFECYNMFYHDVLLVLWSASRTIRGRMLTCGYFSV